MIQYFSNDVKLRTWIPDPDARPKFEEILRSIGRIDIINRKDLAQKVREDRTVNYAFMKFKAVQTGVPSNFKPIKRKPYRTAKILCWNKRANEFCFVEDIQGGFNTICHFQPFQRLQKSVF